MSADERFPTDESPDRESTARDESFGRGEGVAVMDSDEVEGLRERWIAIQAAFIDEPRRSVAEADRLVGDVTDRIARSFEDERTRLEEIWESGADITTEDLRLTLQRYRAFFDRLLTI
ncbi:hypothetical protein BH20GEM1_BH20GEM1_21000 [soil metagenome]